MIDLGFIGVGGMGSYQASAFAAVRGCRIRAASDPHARTLAKFATTYPDIATYKDYRRLLKDPHVDAIVIAVPTGLHATIAIHALASRKPVLVEKPMARTVAECRRMLKAARTHRTLLMVAHCRRFDDDWGALAKVVRGGALGSPVLWRSVSAGHGPGGWFMDDRLGGGPLFDGAIHDYDFANMMFGAPERVVASAIKLKPEVTAVDTASAVVCYESGDQLLVSWSWVARGGNLFDIVGPQGFITPGIGDLSAPKGNASYSWFCVTKSNGRQRLVKGSTDLFKMYTRQARHFLACVRGKRPCRSPGTEAIKAVAVGEAILKASRAGGTQRVRWE